MLRITPQLTIPDTEIAVETVRAQGPGGQNVNKLASAVHLRFDIGASSLPTEIKTRLLTVGDRRISGDGVLVIKAQRHRTRARNLADARERLRQILRAACVRPAARKPTRPPRAAQLRRLDAKSRRARLKRLRGRVAD